MLERLLTVNAVVATVLGSIPASSDTVESDKTVLNTVHKNPPIISCDRSFKLPVYEEDPVVQASVRVQPRGGVQQGRGGAPREGRAHCRLTVRYSDIFLKEQCSENIFPVSPKIAFF